MFDLRQIYEGGFFVMIGKTPIHPDLTKGSTKSKDKVRTK